MNRILSALIAMVCCAFPAVCPGQELSERAQVEERIASVLAELSYEEKVCQFESDLAKAHKDHIVHSETTKDPSMSKYFRRLRKQYRKLKCGKPVEFYLYSGAPTYEVAFEVWNPLTSQLMVYVQLEYLWDRKPSDKLLMVILAHEIGHESQDTQILQELFERVKPSQQVTGDIVYDFQKRADRNAMDMLAAAGQDPRLLIWAYYILQTQGGMTREETRLRTDDARKYVRLYKLP